MTSLSDVETLEYRIIDVRSRPSCTPTDAAVLDAMLEKVRGLKREYLSRHPEVLRKGAAKLHTGPAPQDKPNAPMPMADGSLGQGVEEKLFRAPAGLTDMSIVTCRGVMQIPPHGVVHTNAAHEDLHAELRGRRFKEMKALDRTGKTSDCSDISYLFSRDLLRPIGGADGDVMRGLSARAAKAATAPLERRIEADNRGPALDHCRSLEEFHRRYFGRSF
jgi:hypothetical protein